MTSNISSLLHTMNLKTGKGGLYGMQTPIEWHVKHVGNEVHYIGVDSS